MITLIATVLNEGDNIQHLLNGVLQQTQPPDEIIIVDGGSSDNTVAILKSYETRLPLKIIIKHGCNISQGRNTAIAAAQGDILAITDAGVHLDETWLEQITQPLLENPNVSVVSGFFKADPQTTFEVAMGATVLPVASEIKPDSFLPSSRSIAVRKAAAVSVGGYPEWLDYCEDLIFDLRLKATQPPFEFVPDALVFFRPRGTLRAFYKQYYLYARGDGKADLWRKRHAIRYLTYLVAAPAIVLLSLAIHPTFWFFALLGTQIYLYQPYQRLPEVMRSAPKQSPLAWLQVILLIPVIRVVGDIAKMHGYPAGLRWRSQQHPPDWQQIQVKRR
jgi:glycosyltransferase involved in cell wall biosynthesis